MLSGLRIMHVAFALFRYFPFGGMQRDMLATAKLCRERGHKVTIYCHTWQGELPEDITVEVVPTSGHANHARAQRFARGLIDRLKSARPDRVIGFDKLPGLDLYFAADPCFVTRTASRIWLYRLSPRYRSFRALEGAVFAPQGSTRILLLDERERPNYQHAWQTPSARFELLPPGIEHNRKRGPDSDQLRTNERLELGIKDNHNLVLLLGANFALKGLDRAMRAIASLPEAIRECTQLLAVGQQEPNEFRQLAAQLGITHHVEMLPGREDVPRLLQAADVLIHPAYRDTTGTVLLEALVAGLPVLCTQTCGYAKHIQDAHCGHVLPEPFRQEDLNESLHTLLVEDRTAYQVAAMRYAHDHDLHGMHEQIVCAIEAPKG